MTPDTLFQIANPLALLGWLALVAAPLAPVWADRLSGYAIPLILSVGYMALMMVHFAGAEGGFDSLANVGLLMQNDWLLLAGWVHYLAYDLFVGGWIVRTARAEGISHFLVVPLLIPAFLLGPVGLALFFALRAVRRRDASFA